MALRRRSRIQNACRGHRRRPRTASAPPRTLNWLCRVRPVGAAHDAVNRGIRVRQLSDSRGGRGQNCPATLSNVGGRRHLAFLTKDGDLLAAARATGFPLSPGSGGPCGPVASAPPWRRRQYPAVFRPYTHRSSRCFSYPRLAVRRSASQASSPWAGRAHCLNADEPVTLVLRKADSGEQPLRVPPRSASRSHTRAEDHRRSP